MLRALLASLLPELSAGQKADLRLQIRDSCLWQASLSDRQGVRTCAPVHAIVEAMLLP